MSKVVVYTETVNFAEVEVPTTLYNLLMLEDELGFYYTHRSPYNINELLKEIENDGLDEYDGVEEEHIELLKECAELLESGKADKITFVEEVGE